MAAPQDGYFDFEKPIHDLEKRIQELKGLATHQGVDFSSEIKTLEQKVSELMKKTYEDLKPWHRVQISRHPARPYTLDYIENLFPDFKEIHGDRTYQDDASIVCGIATIPSGSQKGSPLLIVGHQKGRGTKEKVKRNFGMAKPEGYRKAMRVFELAHRSKMPILTLIDTPGAFPGIEAEERGQSQAIAESICLMFKLEVPIISVVIGEGGSGGALAIGIGNKVLMQEYTTYSVISPESCASILWSDSTLAEKASEKLKMDAHHLKSLGVIDGIIPEPAGGAHRSFEEASKLLWKSVEKELSSLSELSPTELAEQRMTKFRKMGVGQISTGEQKQKKTGKK